MLIMRHQQQRVAWASDSEARTSAEALPRFDIEIRERLVEKNEFGLKHQRAGQCYAVAAGHLKARRICAVNRAGAPVPARGQYTRASRWCDAEFVEETDAAGRRQGAGTR